MAVLAVRLWVQPWGWPWARLAGVTLLALALPLFTLPFVHLGRYGGRRAGGSYMDTTRVADKGVYGVVRHPQYLGYILLTWGFALLTPHGATLGLALLGTAGYAAQARVEEAALGALHGDAYRLYAARVPRFNLVAGVWRRFRGRRR